MAEDIGKWLESVEQSLPKQDRGKGLTFGELREKMGSAIGETVLRRRLVQAKSMGLVEISKAPRTNICGLMVPVWVYVIKEKKSK